ncbi:hypothetical protein BgiBS90_018924, partial [Biomphalaria glabrata]
QNYELKNCKGLKLITYYYTHLLSNASLCVLIVSFDKNKTCLQNIAYTQHGFANMSSKGISNVYISVNELDFKNVSVFNKWNQQFKTRYMQIFLVPTDSQEMRIEFDSSNRILLYNI